MTELGRIERPEAAPFIGQRKLYLVPLVYTPAQPSADYAAILARYWFGVREHLRRLEGRLGPINHVFHEAIPTGGEDGLKLAERVNPRSAEIAREKVANGAAFDAVEDPETLAESLDWQRCLMAGLASQKVAAQVWGFYRDASRKRNEHVAKRLDELLKEGEAGVLFVMEEHSLQFPPSIQVFYVAPPALDEVHRWMRDHAGSAEEPSGAEAEAEA